MASAKHSPTSRALPNAGDLSLGLAKLATARSCELGDGVDESIAARLVSDWEARASALARESTRPILVAFGDSIAAGVGAEGDSYPALVANDLGASFLDLTGTNATVAAALGMRSAANDADIVLIGFGVTEALIRPTDRALRFMPGRWRRPGWMDPRPYYSRRRWKRAGQAFESALRWRVKVALIRLTGGTRWMSPDVYEDRLNELVDHLRTTGTSRVVLVSHFGIDDRFFPGSAESLEEFLAINRRVADSKGVLFCEATALCSRWDDFLSDRFHPNRSGHRRIAGHVLASMTEAAAGAHSSIPS